MRCCEQINAIIWQRRVNKLGSFISRPIHFMSIHADGYQIENLFPLPRFTVYPIIFRAVNSTICKHRKLALELNHRKLFISNRNEMKIILIRIHFLFCIIQYVNMIMGQWTFYVYFFAIYATRLYFAIF